MQSTDDVVSVACPSNDPAVGLTLGKAAPVLSLIQVVRVRINCLEIKM